MTQDTKDNTNYIDVQINESEFEFANELSDILAKTIDVYLTPDEIISRIIQSYRMETSYISLVNLTSKVKFSLSEVKRLATFTDRERRALEYVLLSDKRNERIRTLTGLLKVELDIRDGVVGELMGENLTVNELWEELENEYNSKFRNWKLRSGIKKLIIKSAIMSYVLKKEIW